MEFARSPKNSAYGEYKRPLLALGLAAVVATAAALMLPPLWAAAMGAALPLLLLLRRCRRGRAALCLVTAAVLLLSTAAYRRAVVMPLEALDGATDTVTGRVIATPDSGTMATLLVTEGERVPAGTRLGLYCPDSTMPQVGDRITTQVELSRLTHSATTRYAKGVYLYAFPTAREEEPYHTDSGGLAGWLRGVRKSLSRPLKEYLPAEESGVLNALCLGQRNSLSATAETDFRRAGLSHLLVVSGLHLSLVAVAVRSLLRRAGLGIRWSAALTVPVVIAFVLLVGATPSVCRAAVMCLIWLVGQLLWRRSDGLNSLGLAAALLLLYNPYTLLSAGAQLSFFATAGVLWLTPRLCGWLRRLLETVGPWNSGWRTVWTYAYTAAAACVSALLFTLPLACYYFGGFGLWSALSNLLAVGPAGVVLGLGWAGLLLCQTPLLSWLGRPLLLAAGYVTRYLTAVADFCGPEAAYLRVESGWPPALVSGLCLLTVCVIVYPASRRRLAAGMLTLTVLALGVGIPLSVGVTRLTVLPTEEGVALLLRQGDRAALVATHSAAVETAVYALDDRPLTTLAVTETDPTDAPYLAALTASNTTVITEIGEEPISLWEGCTLTPLPGGGYRVDTPAAPLLVDASAEGLLSVVDHLPEKETEGYTVAVVTAAELAEHRPELSEQQLILTETQQPITFVAPAGGEWSVWPWQ